MSWNVTHCNKEQADKIVKKYIEVLSFTIVDFKVEDGAELYATGWSLPMGIEKQCSIWYRRLSHSGKIIPVTVEFQIDATSVRYDFDGCDKIQRMMEKKYAQWLKGSAI